MAARRSPLVFNWSNRKQIVVSGSIFAAAASTHLLPSLRPYTSLFFELPYDEGNEQYLQGSGDVLFVLRWLILLTALRATVLESVYQAVTRFRIVSGKFRVRFAEQSWLLLYYGISFSAGMYILGKSDYWLDFRQLWSEWPTRRMDGQLKRYYLMQLAFYLHQVIAINLEKRRKDYKQMFTHHVITCCLMYICYAYRYTKMGNVILCIMDVVDFFLPLAKMLNYLHWEMACNTTFGVFLATWLIARHIIYVSLCWSIYRDVPNVMSYGCYSGATGKSIDPGNLGAGRYIEPFFDQTGTICLDRKVKWVFLSLLLILQALSFLWFISILRVAYTILQGKVPSDTRSDDEEEVERVQSCIGAQFDPTTSLTTSSDSGLSQSDHHQRGGRRIRIFKQSDRKELIGRVGCNGSGEK